MYGIPRKLWHYVHDMFKPETMEINNRRMTIKITEEPIHELLGVPYGGRNQESGEKNETK